MNHLRWAMAWTLLAGIALGGTFALFDQRLVSLVLVVMGLACALRGHWHAMQDAGGR